MLTYCARFSKYIRYPIILISKIDAVRVGRGSTHHHYGILLLFQALFSAVMVQFLYQLGPLKSVESLPFKSEI